MAAGSYNTQVEYLNKINQDIAGAMTCADADLPFLTELQVKVLEKLRPAGQAPAFPGEAGMGGGGDLGAGPFGREGIPMPPGPGPVGPPPMPFGRNAPPNPDELRRVLGG